MPDYGIPSTNGIPPSEDHCWHAEQAVRRRLFANGVLHYVLQCQTCGTSLRALGKTHPERIRLTEEPPWFDEELTARYWDDRVTKLRERTQEADAEREARSREWWERYDRYIRSPEWRAKADRRLQMDGRRCMAGMIGCTGTATQVHHLTYVHVENEPLFELTSVCRSCHEQLTAMDRERRGVAA